MLETAPAPTVTVVMIFLNAQAYIEEAIESVLAQTCRDFELVLVDDGSTDASTEIAKRYATEHPGRVLYTEHDQHRNRGMSASRNLGVSVGRGKLISFLDSDDIWLPNRLERFVAEIEKYPEAGMLYGPTLYWYSWSRSATQKDYPGRLELPTHMLLPPPLPLRRWLETGGGCLPGICSLIVRREAYLGIGGFEPSFRGLYEDQVFLSKFSLAHPIVVIPDVLDWYRQHPASSCHRGIETGDYHPVKLHRARQRYLVWLQGYCRDVGVTDRGLWKALDQEQWPYRNRLNGFIFNTRQAAPERVRTLLRRYLPPPARQRLRRLVEGYWRWRARGKSASP